MNQPPQSSVFRKKRVLFSLTLSFLIGALIGTLFHKFIAEEIFRKKIYFHEVRKSGYSFINPLFECEPAGIPPELVSFKAKVNDLTEKIIKDGRAIEISVYFRDLNNGPWFDVFGDEKFLPASLMKLPIMMAYLKKAETNPQLLNTSLTFSKDPSPWREHFQGSERLEKGRSYTIEELIERMIKYSDNDAKDLLADYDPKSFDSVQRYLGLQAWGYDKPEEEISVITYATLFRILFNASYLSPEMSEKALEILSQSQFPFGIVQGVPAGTKVAHKFGERYDNYTWQLHDCGIVYYPKRPYLLCIMSRGSSIDELTKVIREISSLVYSQVNKSTKDNV